MLRFKQFAGHGEELEARVNLWLESNEPDITQMVQTVDPDAGIVISFLFEESFRGQELRYAAENGMAAAIDPAVPEVAMPNRRVQVPIEP